MASSKLGLKPLWLPVPGKPTPMSDYRCHVNRKFALNLGDSHELHEWSVTRPQEFWTDLYNYLEIVPPLPQEVTKAYDDTLPLSSIPEFFPDTRLNFTENLFSRKRPDATAIISIQEGESIDGERITWRELEKKVALAASALKRNGIKENDRVAALVSNTPLAVIIFLATASMGAIFSSINPDLGAEGIISRLEQITPSILFAEDSVSYKGKNQTILPKLNTVLERLQKQPKTFVIPVSGKKPIRLAYDDFLKSGSREDSLECLRVSFSHPIVILFSSGTTGPPKCITHHHGTILQYRKMAQLHYSLSSESVVFQYTSTSWVLFNIMIGHLAQGSTIICYNGSPLWPDATILLQIIERHRVTYFGTSPRWMRELESLRVIAREKFELSTLKMVTTTGAALSADQYLWFYSVFPEAVHLSNVCGGTDIATSWLTSDPSGPVYKGEIQMKALGMDVDVADTETGDSIEHTGQSGELICRKPFASMPIYFWGDRDGQNYFRSYFEGFPKQSVWMQHDWISINTATKGIIVHGRSDGVLNPSGIRFGTAEIYSVVEGPAFNQIEDTLCVGRKRSQDQDEAVFLFVKMRSGHSFSTGLVTQLKTAIRSALSPRHVPTFVQEVKEIPVTINGKKVEIAVKQVISGKEVKISSTVANPKSFDYYHQFQYLEEDPKAKL